MRSYPHAPHEEILTRLFKTTQALAVPASAATRTLQPDRAPGFWTSNARALLDCARLAYALEQPAEVAMHYFRETAVCFDEGVGIGAPFDLDDHFDQLELAIVLGDVARVTALCDLPADRHVIEGVSFPAAVEREFETLAELAVGRVPSAGSSLNRAAAALATKRLPKLLRDDIDSILALQRQILAGNQTALAEAFARRSAAFEAKFRNPAIANSPRSLLDLNGLAHAALARRAGLDVAVDSVYLPLALLRD
jgi:hypothetical protein